MSFGQWMDEAAGWIFLFPLFVLTKNIYCPKNVFKFPKTAVELVHTKWEEHIYF